MQKVPEERKQCALSLHVKTWLPPTACQHPDGPICKGVWKLVIWSLLNYVSTELSPRGAAKSIRFHIWHWRTSHGRTRTKPNANVAMRSGIWWRTFPKRHIYLLILWALISDAPNQIPWVLQTTFSPWLTFGWVVSKRSVAIDIYTWFIGVDSTCWQINQGNGVSSSIAWIGIPCIYHCIYVYIHRT